MTVRNLPGGGTSAGAIHKHHKQPQLPATDAKLDGTGNVDPTVDVKQRSDATSADVVDSGASAALRALSMQGKVDGKKSDGNGGSSSATLGAKLMGLVKSDAGRKVGAAIGLGMSLMGMVQPAMADVVHVGNTAPVQQAGQQIAKDTKQPYVQVSADKQALEQVLQKAEAGQLSLKHLILEYDDPNPSYGSTSKLPAQWEWQQWQQKYPKAFAQVEQVHVIGANLDGNLLKSWQGTLFPNAKAVVSFDLSTALDQGPASAWVLQQTAKTVGALPGGDKPLSAQDALVQAKAIANQGASGGVRTRVDVGQQSDTQAPKNALSEWLDAQQQLAQSGTSNTSASMTRQTLETKLKEFASAGTLTDGMLGSLAGRLEDRGFKIDYDAARLASHLIDIRRAGGAQMAIDALLSGKVHQVRHDLAAAADTTQYAQPKSALFQTEVPRGVPIAGDKPIATGGIQGAAYLVDGFGTIRNGEVNVQAIRHPKHGDGLQLTFKLGDGAGHKLEELLNQRGATIVDKTIVNQAPVDGRVVTAEKGDVVQAAATVDNQQPDMSIGPTMRVEKAGAYRVDYFPESISKQSLRNEVQLQVYGKTDAERNQALRTVLAELGLKDAVGGAPSEETERKLQAMRLLEQADPRSHHALRAQIESGKDVTLAQLHDALMAAEVPPAFLQQAYFSEGAPGHLSVIVPGQSEAYARRGVRAVYHTVSKAEIFAFIAADGANMSTKDRLQVGKVFRGMSSDTDLRTGGADFVFTRQVTAPMGNPSMSDMRGGAIVMKSDILDRADWFAYSGDQYGTTLAGDRGAPSDAVKQAAQRTLQAQQQKGDAPQGQSADGWLSMLIQGQVDSRENTYLQRPVGRQQVKQTVGSSNETMLEGTIPVSQIETFLVRTQEDKDKTIEQLKKLGVTEINGKKVEDFIQVRDKFFTDDQMKQFELQPVDATPTDKVGDKAGDKDKGDKKPDNRLQFYVRLQPGAGPAGSGSGSASSWIA